MKHHGIILLILFLTVDLFAQVKDYRIEFSDAPAKGFEIKSGRSDSAAFIFKVNNLRNQLLSDGYLLANIDELSIGASLMKVKINVGDIYTWHALGVDNIPEVMLSKSGYRKRDFRNVHYSEKDFKRLMSKLLSEAANTGYPFASFQLQDISLNSKYIKAVLSYEPGPVIYYDSLTVTPSNIVNHRFLEANLDVREGDLFSIKNIKGISSAINQLPYCTIGDSISMSFQYNLCNINVPLKPIPVNKIDALVGILPASQNSGSVVITGFVNLHLYNLFRSGKELSFIWRQFQKESQTLIFAYQHPNLLRSPLGLSLNLDILKQDSSFLNTNLAIAAFYGRNYIRVSFTTDIITSRTLSSTLNPLRVPKIIDFNLSLLGMNVMLNKLDDPFNPINGYKLFAGTKLGNKRILKHPDLPEEVYDSINMRTTQTVIRIGAEINKPLLGPLVFHADANMEWINNSQLYVNDMIRLGGINSLRGFNDLDILVSSYMLFRFEPRLLISSTSRLFVFYDQGFTFNKVTNLSDKPRGFGAGLVLDTGLGNLQLVYALGVSDQQSLSLTQSRIHIGYVARF